MTIGVSWEIYALKNYKTDTCRDEYKQIPPEELEP
jgi:hypothetical protein